MAKTSRSSKKESRRFLMLAALKRALTSGAAASLVLCLVTPVLCLLSSPALTAALQGTSVRPAMADDPGVTVTPPIEVAQDEIPVETYPVQSEGEAAPPDATNPEEQNGARTPTAGSEAIVAPNEEEPSDSVETPPDREPVGETGALEDDPDSETYLDSPIPREEDLPTGPDTTWATETGMPVEGGVSAEPIETLMQTIEERVACGDGAVALQVDGNTGTVEYL